MLLAGSAISGLGAYAFQIVGTRALGDEAYAPIGVLWTIQYLALTVAFVSVEAYVARGVTLASGDLSALRRAILPLGAWTLGISGGVGAAAWIWSEPLFHGHGTQLALVAALTVAGFGAYSIVRGLLAGTYRFREYGATTAAESGLRLAAAAPIALLAPTTVALAWSLPLGPLAAAGCATVALALRRGHAIPKRAAAGLPTGSTGRYLAAVTTANASAQTLLAAGPLVLIPLGASPAEISIVFITVTAARVPLVFLFGGVLSRVLPSLTRAAVAGDAARLRRWGAIAAGAAASAAAAGAALGAWLGPGALILLFGADFAPPGWLVAFTVAGMVAITASLGLNQIFIAMAAESRIVAPWLLALTVGITAVAVMPGEPMLRVVAGFAIGEGVALLALTLTLLRTQSRHPAQPPAPGELAPILPITE